MNYFELFEIPVKLKIDPKALTTRFFELSKRFHPDFHVNSSEANQSDSLEKSANLNKALKTLKNPEETIKYVLQIKNLMEEDEKYQLPQDFLMEVLEVNEMLMEAQLEEDDEKMKNYKKKVHALEMEIYNPVSDIIENYEDGKTNEKELLQVKEYYYKKKYLQRIHAQLNQMQ